MTVTKYGHLKGEYVRCRTLSHAWDEIQDDGGVGNRQYKASRTILIKLFRCIHCGMKRYETWNRITGTVMFRTYRQPEGYKQPKGITRQKMRIEYLSRQEAPTPRKRR